MMKTDGTAPIFSTENGIRTLILTGSLDEDADY